MADLTAQAHALHARGLHPFTCDHPDHPDCIGAHVKIPCDGQRGKHPTGAWKTWSAAVRPQQIDRAWSKYNGLANIGIACGPSNLVVLDEDQAAELDKWCVTYGVTLPETYEVTTGRGRHLYYEWDHSAKPIGNGSKAFDTFKIDVRGQGGMVIARRACELGSRRTRHAATGRVIAVRQGLAGGGPPSRPPERWSFTTTAGRCGWLSRGCKRCLGTGRRNGVSGLAAADVLQLRRQPHESEIGAPLAHIVRIVLTEIDRARVDPTCVDTN